MPIQAPQWTEFLSCPVCYNVFNNADHKPVSLACSHTVCTSCLAKLQQKKCPFDQSLISHSISEYPVNFALLQLVCPKAVPEEKYAEVAEEFRKYYKVSKTCVEELALLLKPVTSSNTGSIITPPGHSSSSANTSSNNSSSAEACVLSRPMQRKLITLINCQLVEEEGCSRAVRAARSLGERTVTELILQHQNTQQLSSNLWAAVRGRGCQFLGPAMQEEVLKLILLALEDGSALSRKVLVLFVVQRLESHYPQASKTAIGHVVQLLYRASCFKVTKRDEESSLMQLKEELRMYDALRREHDTQIVQIAMEAGLRIAPDQWSSLLYGDSSHKSHMQSIIDKLQTPQTFVQSVSELLIALQRTGDSYKLQRLQPQLEFLASIDSGPDVPPPSWENLEGVMKAVRTVVQGLVDFLQNSGHKKHDFLTPFNVRYKTSMCRDFVEKKLCPRGTSCTFAHSEDELEKYRQRNKRLGKNPSVQESKLAPPSSSQLSPVARHTATNRQINGGSGATKDSGLVRTMGSLTVEGAEVSPGPVATVSPSTHPAVTGPPATQATPTMPQDSPRNAVPPHPPGMMPGFDMTAYPGMGQQMGAMTPMNMMYGQYPMPFMPCYPGFMPYSRLNPYAEPWTPCAHQQFQQHQQMMRQVQAMHGQMPGMPGTMMQGMQGMMPGMHGPMPNAMPGVMPGGVPGMAGAVPSAVQGAMPGTMSTVMESTHIAQAGADGRNSGTSTGSREECSICHGHAAGQEAGIEPSGAGVAQEAAAQSASQSHVVPATQNQMIAQAHRQSISNLQERRNSLLAQLHSNSNKNTPSSQKVCSHCARPTPSDTKPKSYSDLLEKMGMGRLNGSNSDHEMLMEAPRPRNLVMPDPMTKQSTHDELFKRLEAISNLPPRSVSDSVMASWVTSALTTSIEQKGKPQVSYMNGSNKTLQNHTSMNSNFTSGNNGSLSAHISDYQSNVRWSEGDDDDNLPSPPFSADDAGYSTSTHDSFWNSLVSYSKQSLTGATAKPDSGAPTSQRSSSKTSRFASYNPGNESIAISTEALSMTPQKTSVAKQKYYASEGDSRRESKSMKSDKNESRGAELYWQSEYEDFPYWQDVTRTLESPTPALGKREMGLHLFEEEDLIPFDPPIVSKFGPISRMARSKYNNTEPVQVTADEMMKTTPVTAVTPLSRPVPSAHTVPSKFPCNAPGLTSVHSLRHEDRPALVVSDTDMTAGIQTPQLWSSVAQLEKKAQNAKTKDERLSCELQAVEMQISMKQQELKDVQQKVRDMSL